MEADKGRKTLGDNVIPMEYILEFEPDFRTFRYKGKCTIKVLIKKPTNKIALNSAELAIRDARVTSGKDIQDASIRTSAKDETLLLVLKRPAKGKAELCIEFDGTNNDGMYGFYRSRYLNNGKEGYILTSQFEPADARKAFPCFDEPEFKAVFSLSFIVDSNLEAISNMPIKNTKALGSKKRITFYTTPRMSTYLLYLAVGKFEYNTSKYRNMMFRVITVPGRGKNTKMPMDFGKRFLKFYESYFGIDFPLPKMDLIAIPDFSAGAMENWGAITFREIELLGDEKATSTAVKQRIAEVIAHELAHQWFGDLVTMRWWDDLWLNESFATFMATKAVDSVFPEWEFGLQDSVGILSTALAADQYMSTHPINVRVSEPSEINEIFDSISYDKGGSVLAMLEDYAGKEAFRKGLHAYLGKHAYSNATKYDLWDAIEAITRKIDKNTKFSKVAKDWIDKTGYP
ncbi:MAG: M1 family metallopeptidase, partial [Candidatus Micrarchaeaceae archaeon]